MTGAPAPSTVPDPVAAVRDALPTRRRKAVAVVALAGPVAVGKSTFAAALAAGLGRPVTVVCLDAFLRPNAELDRDGLTLRKGFPETYDVEALTAALDRLRAGRPTLVPVYSHLIYDREPGPGVQLAPGAVVVVEGLHALAFVAERDLGVYLHAPDDVVVRWFVQRFCSLCDQARRRPGGFYDRFAHLDHDARVAFARTVWDLVNGPNQAEHVAPTRSLADLVIHKDGDHQVVGIEDYRRRAAGPRRTGAAGLRSRVPGL